MSDRRGVPDELVRPRRFPAADPEGRPFRNWRWLPRLPSTALPVTAIRGLLHRSRATILIFILAAVGSAAAAAGPAYYQAAKVSVLRDAFSSSLFVDGGFEATGSGNIAGLLASTSSNVNGDLTFYLGPAAGQHLFAPEVSSIESNVTINPYGGVSIVYRTGFCGHLKIQGTCPTRPGQIIISQSFATITGWRIGHRLKVRGWSPFTVTGLYAIPRLTTKYWSTRGEIYFPQSSTTQPQASAVDSLFTARSSLDDAGQNMQGTVAIDDQLIPANLSTANVDELDTDMIDFANDSSLSQAEITITSNIAGTIQSAESAWHSVAVPVALITAELLGLCLLMLFTAVTEAVDSRGTDIALARLRGHGRIRTLGFGLAEPVVVLLIALPAGVLAGWLVARALSGVMLRPQTPVALPLFAWAAAALVAVAGFAAVVVAAFRAVRRPISAQWRRTSRQITQRGWILDAMLGTLAIAALADLLRGGTSSNGNLSLLVPGLLGLAVAVIASRILPVACRLIFPSTSRRPDLGLYLALRHIARRPGGVRTTIVLATAFTLATYAVGGWLVIKQNEHTVAVAAVGAPTVLTVSPPAGKDLSAIVDRADPTGSQAATVLRYTDEDSSDPVHTLLAVEPARFARVAAAIPGFSVSPRSLQAQLDPAEPPPTVLTGDALRVTVTVHSLAVPKAVLTADVATQGSTPVVLGTLPPSGTVTRTAGLTGCPCILQDLDISAPGDVDKLVQSGSVSILSLDVHRAGQWVPAGTGLLGRAALWLPTFSGAQNGSVTPGAAGLLWKFQVAKLSDAVLVSVNRPERLPALLAARVSAAGPGIFPASGLDGNTTLFRAVSVQKQVPGAEGGAAIVDMRYAELTAANYFPQADQQVWLAAGARPAIEMKLRAAGVKILAVRSISTVAALLGRQGPGLANILFLVDAAAAVLLASGSAVLGLYISARRRRYEYAALEATGVPRSALRRSLLIEMGVLTAFGSILGIATGLVAIAIALHAVPEFISIPPVALSYQPPGAGLALSLAAGVVLLLAAGFAAAVALLGGIRPDQLRDSAV
jgi:putative ABC transport system permease protein